MGEAESESLDFPMLNSKSKLLLAENIADDALLEADVTDPVMSQHSLGSQSLNSSSAKSVLVGEKLVATYSIST
jgi:hypothetical protein